MDSVCACSPVTLRVCVSCRDHSASAASLISQHRGTCLNSKRGLERTSCPPGESLRLPSTRSGHSSYHTLLGYAMSNPPVGKKTQDRGRTWGMCIFVCSFCPCMVSGKRLEMHIRKWDFFFFLAVCGSHQMWCMISSSSKRQNCATTAS